MIASYLENFNLQLYQRFVEAITASLNDNTLTPTEFILILACCLWNCAFFKFIPEPQNAKQSTLM